jgi:hypothetical protein
MKGEPGEKGPRGETGLEGKRGQRGEKGASQPAIIEVRSEARELLFIFEDGSVQRSRCDGMISEIAKEVVRMVEKKG